MITHALLRVVPGGLPFGLKFAANLPQVDRSSRRSLTQFPAFYETMAKSEICWQMIGQLLPDIWGKIAEKETATATT